MQLTSRKWARVSIYLLASLYLFTGIMLLRHYHRDGIDHDNCSICYYLNNNYQDLPSQLCICEFILLQIFYLSESVAYTPKIVYLHDPARAPPKLHIV
jgi:hypothetical protein